MKQLRFQFLHKKPVNKNNTKKKKLGMWRKNTLITLARLSARILKTSCHLASRLVSQQSWQSFFVSVSWVRALACMPVTLAMFYLSIGLAGYLVGPVISCGTRKLARTPRVTKKKRKLYIHRNYQFNKKKGLKREQFLLWFGALLIRQHLIIMI